MTTPATTPPPAPSGRPMRPSFRRAAGSLLRTIAPTLLILAGFAASMWAAGWRP